MAARRRTQEEKNLKTLKELASLPANKQCFDCRQRGPTYVNVTIGCFVCTSCSGILRGLNPPHRVKSITMTTFSMEEIEFIKSRGNEYCQYVWMGLYDSRVLETESRDEQRIRDFMLQKYERKRWYVDPDIAMKKMQQDQQQRQNSVPSSSSQGNLVPETKPLSSLLGNNATSLVVQPNQGNSNTTWPPAVTSSTAHQVPSSANTRTQAKGQFEFVNDFDGNAFTNTRSTEGTTANGNFANFESAFSTPALTTQSNFHQRKACTPPAGWTSFDDDLDPLSSTSPLPSSSSSHRQFNVSHPLSTKPSYTNTTTTTSTIMPRPLSLPTFSPTNPFSSPSNKLSECSTPSQWPSFPATTSATVRPATTGINQIDNFTFGVAVLNTTSKVGTQSNSQSSTSQQIQPPPADKYAALADLDSLFHTQSAVTTSTTSSWPVTEASFFGTTATLRSEGTGNYVGDIGSNPFSSDSLAWNKPPPATQTQKFATANPFQAMVAPSSGLHSQTTTAFGTSAEEGFANFSGNASFPAFPVNNMTNLPNGIPASQFGTQNGRFGVNSSVMMWGGNTNAWGTEVMNHQNATQMPFQERKLEPSPWIQQSVPTPAATPANPFLDRNGSTVPRTNPSNPFL